MTLILFANRGITDTVCVRLHGTISDLDGRTSTYREKSTSNVAANDFHPVLLCQTYETTQLMTSSLRGMTDIRLQ